MSSVRGKIKQPSGVAMRWVLLAVAMAALTGCATYSEKITPTYVSPVLYENLNCRQIAEEATRVSARAAEAAGAQDAQANRDNAVTAAAIIVFWPAAFFVGGDRQNATEVEISASPSPKPTDAAIFDMSRFPPR